VCVLFGFVPFLCKSHAKKLWREIKGHFNPFEWVSASENLTYVFRGILEQTGDFFDKESTREELVDSNPPALLKDDLKKL
jgi:hypothetical protein